MLNRVGRSDTSGGEYCTDPKKISRHRKVLELDFVTRLLFFFWFPLVFFFQEFHE